MSSPGIGGILPVQTNADASPSTQNFTQQIQGMNPQQLQQLALRLGNTPQGQMAQKVLQQKRVMPTQATSGFTQPQNPMMQSPGGMQSMQQQQGGGMVALKKGGILHRAAGGASMSMDSPWWERQEVRGSEGFLHGITPGRADSIRTSAPSGSYVLPADVVSGLGEGNSLAGARIVQEAMGTGPWGTPVPRGGHGSTIPRPPRAPEEDAKGGGVHGGKDKVGHPIPVMLSHGEIVLTPDQVAHVGSGNLKDGFKILDEFVKETRKRTIAKMKNLPGPAK